MRGLMLEGGGAKGAYEAGAIKALNKRKITFDCVGGTSIGALNAACYVVNNFEGMYKIWLTKDTNDLFGINPKLINDFEKRNLKGKELKEAVYTIKNIIKNRGIDTNKIKKVFESTISEEKFRKSKVDFAMNTVNLNKLKSVKVFKKDIPEGKLIEYLLSSAYLPVFKLEKIIDDNYYLDGGFSSNCPVDMLIDKGYDEIYVIKAWQTKLKYKYKKGITVHVITPREDLGHIMSFDPKRAKYRMNLGYYDMIKYLDNLDGNRYYFKNYDEKYYDKLFDKISYKRIIKEYNNGLKPKSNKRFIIKMFEKICEEQSLERFKIYNPPYLISKLKYRLAGKSKNKYYNFVKNIKVDFES